MTFAHRDRRKIYLDRINSAVLWRISQSHGPNARQAAIRRHLLRVANGRYPFPLKHLLAQAGAKLDETNLRRFVVSLGQMIKAKKYQSGRPLLNAIDSLILALADGFDILSVKKGLSVRGECQIRDLPPLLNWSSPAASTALNWYCCGKGIEEWVTPKTYLTRLRRLGLKCEIPVLVREAKVEGANGSLRSLSVHFSPEGETWWREKVLQKTARKM